MEFVAKILAWLFGPLVKDSEAKRYPNFAGRWPQEPRPQRSRFEGLEESFREMVDTPQKYFDLHCREQKRPIATNADSWALWRFQLGLLYWGAGDIPSAKREFEHCTSAYLSGQKAFAELGHIPEIREEFEQWPGEHLRRARIAGYLIDAQPLPPPATGSFYPDDEGGEFWFDDAIRRACVDGDPIDDAAFERSRNVWLKSRNGVTRLEDWDFYRSVLEGEWQAREEEMFRRHAQIYARRKKRNTSDFLSGEGDFNDMVVDFRFAAILKRIGWKGRYRHAWPDDGVVPAVGAAAETDVAAGAVLKGVASAGRKPLHDAAFPDYTVEEALERIRNTVAELYDGHDIGCDRDVDRKNRAALAKLGIGPHAPDYKLMTAIDLEKLPSRHRVPELANPWGMEERTQALHESIRMHPELLILSMPDEALQWEEPQGTVFVYRPIDGRVYVADAEHLPDVERVMASVTPGMSVWPNLASFLVWYVCEESD